MNANDLLKNLNAPELNNPNFTNSFTQLISDINTNFKILAGAPFGVGGPGDSVVSYMEYLFVKSGNEILLTNIGYEVFKVLFPEADLTGVNVENERNERKYETIKGKINGVYRPINNIGVLEMFDVKINASPNGNVCEWAWCGTELIDGNHKPILPISLYQFYDQRTSGLSGTNDTSFEDMTASVFATLDESGNIIYKSLSIYPKLYFDRENKYWAWMINNERTGINATGPKGSPGSAGSALLYDGSRGRGVYFYEGVEKVQDDMISDGILKEGSIRFRVVNEEFTEGEDPIPIDPVRSELYLDAYSIIDGIGAWRQGIQLYKTLDNWLIKNYFDEIHARIINTASSETLRVLGLPIFSSYEIDETSKIGYPAQGSTITGYHSIEPRREKIGDSAYDILHIQPIVAADLFNKTGTPQANNSIPFCDMQILDYVNIYVKKAGSDVYANIKNNSFSILNSALQNEYTKQTINGIEVLNTNFKSNLSSGGLLVQMVNGYEGNNIIQSNLSRNGLTVTEGLNTSQYRADRIQMINVDSILSNTYNKITSNLLYIGTQRVDDESFEPGVVSRGFYVTGNTDTTTEGKEYRSVLYENTSVKVGRTRRDTKKSNTSTVDNIEIKEIIKPGSTKTNTISLDSNIITDGTNINEITIDKIKITNSVSIPGETNPTDTTAEINPYGGMLVPIGGIIMWPYRIGRINPPRPFNSIPKGFIPCGKMNFIQNQSTILNIEQFHDKVIVPYFEKLMPEGHTTKYAKTELVAANSTDTVVIIRPENSTSGRYYKFNGISIPNLPIPTYPVATLTDGYCMGTEDDITYDNFIYIMRVF